MATASRRPFCVHGSSCVLYYAAAFEARHFDSQIFFSFFLRCTSCNAGTAVEIDSVHAHRLGRGKNEEEEGREYWRTVSHILLYHSVPLVRGREVYLRSG